MTLIAISILATHLGWELHEGHVMLVLSVSCT